MADPKFVTIQTERGEVRVRLDLTMGNSFQASKDKAAEHQATGSCTGTKGDMPKVIHSGSTN